MKQRPQRNGKYGRAGEKHGSLREKVWDMRGWSLRRRNGESGKGNVWGAKAPGSHNGVKSQQVHRHIPLTVKPAEQSRRRPDRALPRNGDKTDRWALSSSHEMSETLTPLGGNCQQGLYSWPNSPSRTKQNNFSRQRELRMLVPPDPH